MNMQEMVTAAELGTNVKIMLMNNSALGLVRQQQDLFFKKNYFASEFSHSIDFTTIARAIGLEATDLNNAKDPRAALEQALTSHGPHLVQLCTDPNNQVLPMVPPGGANMDMIGETHNA